MFERYRLGYQLLLAVAAVEFALAFTLGMAPLTTYVKPGGFIGRMLPAWVVLPLLWAGLVAIEITRRQVDRPFVAVRRMLHRHRFWLLRGILFIGLILFLGRAFTSYKTVISDYNPYWADPWFVAFDHALFGTDPWRITHALIGPYGTMMIDRIYALWFVIMMLYLGWFCFSRNPALQVRGLLTHLLTWGLLGNLAATVFSSVGPCYYDHFFGDARFVPMVETLRATDEQYPLFALKAMDFLLRSFGKDQFGAGISAMPSLHVGVAFMCFLVAREYARHLLPKVLAAAFFAVIFLGSVHLGWHYFADGLFSVAGVGLIWWSTGRLIAWLDRREGRLAEPAAEAAPVPA
jgi:PAP2 superfamily